MHIYYILYYINNFSEFNSWLSIIKYDWELFKETILKFIKQYTHKYVRRILLSIYMLFFCVLLTESNELEDNNKIENNEKYLTKKNYLKYLKPEMSLIFLSAYNQNNKDYIETFYRRNLIMQEKSDIEMIFISQILKILLITFTNSKNPKVNELTKDYYTDLILKQYYINNNTSIFVEEQNSNQYRNISLNLNEKDKEINCKQMKEFINTLEDIYKSLYNIINIFNTEGVIYIISVSYLKALKKFKKKFDTIYIFIFFI